MSASRPHCETDASPENVTTPGQPEDTQQETRKPKKANGQATRRETKQLQRLRRFLLQKRVLQIATVATTLHILIWIVCIATDNWLVYTFSEVHTDSELNKILYYTSGLWRSCINTAKSTDCRTHLFLSGDTQSYDFYYGNMTSHEYESTLTVRRSEIAFAIVTLVLMVVGNFFAAYSIRHVRYTYKRLTAGVHILTAICAVVCLEIVMNIPKTVKTSVESTSMKEASGKASKLQVGHSHVPTYGFSLILGWLVFSVYLLSGLLFLLFSKKLNGQKAPTAEIKEANEPLQFSRP